MSLLGTPRDIFACTMAGLTLAALFSGIAAAVFAMRGSSIVHRIGMTLPQVIGCYVGGGFLGGIVAGGLLPMAKTRWGAPIVGFLALLPFSLAVCISMVGVTKWIPGAIAAVITAALLGAGPATVDR